MANKEMNVLLLAFQKKKKKEVWFPLSIYNGSRATLGLAEVEFPTCGDTLKLVSSACKQERCLVRPINRASGFSDLTGKQNFSISLQSTSLTQNIILIRR